MIWLLFGFIPEKEGIYLRNIDYLFAGKIRFKEPSSPSRRGAIMANRKVADCRLMPSEKDCSVCISGTEEEVLTLATRHAISEHGHADTPELREQIKGMLKD